MVPKKSPIAEVPIYLNLTIRLTDEQWKHVKAYSEWCEWDVRETIQAALDFGMEHFAEQLSLDYYPTREEGQGDDETS